MPNSTRNHTSYSRAESQFLYMGIVIPTRWEFQFLFTKIVIAIKQIPISVHENQDSCEMRILIPGRGLQLLDIRTEYILHKIQGIKKKKKGEVTT
jgi:hypothetical protein